MINQWSAGIWLLGILCAVALGMVVLSFVVLLRARTMVAAAEQEAETIRRENEAALDALRERVEALHNQMNDLRREPASSVSTRPALNLNKRSQALRMHRRGDSPEQIAAALEIPRQELDLLVKVHHIIMSSI